MIVFSWYEDSQAHIVIKWIYNNYIIYKTILIILNGTFLFLTGLIFLVMDGKSLIYRKIQFEICLSLALYLNACFINDLYIQKTLKIKVYICSKLNLNIIA